MLVLALLFGSSYAGQVKSALCEDRVVISGAMTSLDVEAAYADLVEARREGRADTRGFGEIQVQSTLHVGDGSTFFCHVMERVAPGRWELWRSPGSVFALRVGSHPSMWLDAGTIALDTTFGAFIPEAAAEEIQSLEDEDVTIDFAMDILGQDTFSGSRREAVVKTPNGAAIAVFHLPQVGSYPVSKGLDAGGRVCVIAVRG